MRVHLPKDHELNFHLLVKLLVRSKAFVDFLPELDQDTYPEHLVQTDLEEELVYGRW